MGTSTQFEGVKGNPPLIPDWLLPDQNNSEQNIEDNRFKRPRSEFTKFVNSGGGDLRSFGHSVSDYVKNSLGGSKNASLRMKVSVDSVSKFVEFISDLNSNRHREIIKKFNINKLIGRNTVEVLLELFEEFCPNGGTLDDGIVRNGYERMIEDVLNEEFNEINKLESQHLLFMLNRFISHTIEIKLYCDVGINSINLPESSKKVEKIQNQVINFIHRSVCDAVHEFEDRIWHNPKNKFQKIVAIVYENAYELMKTLAEVEMEK